MSFRVLPLPLLLLLLLLAVLVVVRPSAAATEAETTLYILQGKSAEFRCFYDANIDTITSGELAVSVQNCSQRQDMVVVEERITELAAVLGRRTLATPAYRAVFSPPAAAEPPAFALNPRHRLLRDGAVRLAHGNATAIVVTIDAAAGGGGAAVDSLCATCGQAGDTFTYTETKKSVIRIVSPPTVQLTVNGAPATPGLTAGGSGAVSVSEGEPLLIDCVGYGVGELTARLTKSGRTLAASSTAKVSHSVPATSAPSDSGLYQCHVTSSLAYLVREGQETGSANFTLAVSFPPRFELDEVVRFTPLGEREDVQVKVSAFPEAHLSCSYTAGGDDSSNLVTRESYDLVQYYTVFRVTLSNLDRANKETHVTCQAVNRLGSRELRLRLTALAPTPEIVSDAATNWWNSYHLRWQHHVKANVDYYRIRVVHLTPSGKVLNDTQQQLDKVQQEDEASDGVSRWNGLVFDLRPDSPHNISLQACNRHGCSDFSDSVRVHTARESESAFNNPDNPVFAKPQSDQKPGNAASPQTDRTGKGALAVTTGSLFGCLLASRIRLPW